MQLINSFSDLRDVGKWILAPTLTNFAVLYTFDVKTEPFDATEYHLSLFKGNKILIYFALPLS